MNEILAAKLIDLAFTMAEVALERQAVMAHVQELIDKGAKAEDLPAALEKMRDEAIKNAETVIDKA
jgi:hypothetical protein